MRIVGHAELAPDEVLDHWRIPAARRVANVLRTPFDLLGELLSLGFGELTRSPWRRCVNQAGHALEQELISVITNGLLSERHHLGYFTNTLALSEGEEGVDAFNQFQRAAGVGSLETTIELFAGKRAER